METPLTHGGEARDHTITTMADVYQQPCDSGKTFGDIFANTGQICEGLEAGRSEKSQKHVHLAKYSDKDLIKKLLMGKRIFLRDWVHTSK